MNHVLVTVDCCRYDTMEQANTPFLDSLGPLRRAVTYGTYTLPAHISMYHGYLPRTLDRPYWDFYCREKMQLWRLSGARRRDPTGVAMLLEGRDLMEGFRNIGFYTLGVGGVRWFRNPSLTERFDQFLFWGPDDSEDVFTPRCGDHFALNHVDRIADVLHAQHRWFLFLNCQETHVPYDTGDEELDDDVLRMLAHAKPIWGGKDMAREAGVGIRLADLRLLHDQQKRAMSVVDRRLQRLLAHLPKPMVVVVCGDHGEAFGEGRRFGHGFPDPAVLDVPLTVGVVT